MRALNVLRRPLVGIDVGTAVTRVSFRSGGIREQRSVVCEEVHGSTIERPAMRAGVVADVSGVAGVVHALLAPRWIPWRWRPGAVICAPTDVSAPERESLIAAVAEGGASVVAVVPEPLAAAVGAGIDIASEYATALVDIDDGVTDFAVFRNGTMIHSQARRIGCGTFRTAVRESLDLSDDAVEPVVREFCRGEASQLETLLDPVIDEIASFLGTAIRELPDELAAELIESGIHVTGGGACLDRLIARIERTIALPLTRTADPLHAVIRGVGKMLENERLLP